MLAEAREGVVVLGIGVNVNQTREELPAGRGGAGRARCGRSTGACATARSCSRSLLERLDGLYAAWREGGLDAVYDDLGARDFLRGRRVVVDGIGGVAQMITRDGRLEIETASGPVLVQSGEVALRALTAPRACSRSRAVAGRPRARAG